MFFMNPDFFFSSLNVYPSGTWQKLYDEFADLSTYTNVLSGYFLLLLLWNVLPNL